MHPIKLSMDYLNIKDMKDEKWVKMKKVMQRMK